MADYQQDHRPTRLRVPRQAVNQESTCCCGVPDDASSAVKYTRRISIALIVIHVVAMISWWFQYIGNAIGIVMGSILLCSSKKCTYTTAGFLYILGFVLDAINAGLLITLIFMYDTDGEAVEDTDGVVVEDTVMPTGYALLFILPPLLGAFLFLFGAVYAFKASRNWELSGLPF